MVSGSSPGVQVPGFGWIPGVFPGYGSSPGMPWACQVSTAGQVVRPGLDGTATVHGTAPPPLPMVSRGPMLRQVLSLRWSVRYHGPPFWLLVLPSLCQVCLIGLLTPLVGPGSVNPVVCMWPCSSNVGAVLGQGWGGGVASTV